jgi:hypothetical protein
MRDYLEEQIASRRKRLAALDKERIALNGEIAAYADALAKALDGSIDQTKLASITAGRPLPVSNAWRTILMRMATFAHFNSSEVMLAAQVLNQEGKLKKPQTWEGVRAQLSLYTRKGIVKRLGGGNYRLTDSTKMGLGLGAKTSLGQSS